MNVIPEILFHFFININVQFGNEKLFWEIYTAAKAMFIARRVKWINKHEFVKAMLDDNSEAFVVYLATLEVLAKTTIHFFCAAQVWQKAAELAVLQGNKALIKILFKYSDYANVFSLNLAMKLPENTGINKYTF